MTLSTSTSRPIGIAVIDDIPIVIEGVKLALSDREGLRFIGGAHNSREAVSLLSDNRKLIDVVLLDLNLKEKVKAPPRELCERIIKEFPHVKIVAYSIYNGSSLIRNLKGMGVHGYLNKGYQSSELIEAIHSVHNNKLHFPAKKELKQLEFSEEKDIDHIQDNIEIDLFPYIGLLTSRQLDVGRLIVNQGLNNHEIAEALNISAHTVNIHRNTIFKIFKKPYRELCRKAGVNPSNKMSSLKLSILLKGHI